MSFDVNTAAATPTPAPPRRTMVELAEQEGMEPVEARKVLGIDVTDQVAVKVEKLDVIYRTSYEKVPTFKSALKRMGKGERVVKEVLALHDVSFEITHGTVLGIVGHNGAGKSTLMRAIAGILPPSAGRIEVHGRISTLLALGVGFNPALSGRENVMLGGLAAGLSREEVNERYQVIADFAELGEFIEMPMRTYSSGMFSRLAFSVAVHMEPDVLIIDEALSAGDAKFKKKAAQKMDELMGQARTMLLVSHALGTIKEMCNDAIWLDHGRLMGRGDPGEMVDAYLHHLDVGDDATAMEDL
ncbi:MAG: ABC transporter ATP-binding protein [Actinomycetales bacterium]|nr:ABC transporter ATP-binding protein [Actinomycetales bacterium]